MLQLFPVDRDTHDCLCRIQGNVLDSASVFCVAHKQMDWFETNSRHQNYSSESGKEMARCLEKEMARKIKIYHRWK